MHHAARRTKTREMLRDMVHCHDFPELSQRLGFVPASEDVEEIEHRESHFRCEALFPILPDIFHAATEAGALLSAMSEENTPEYCEENVDAARRVCVAVIARLVDDGALEVTR
jgi:hypothetical protein